MAKFRLEIEIDDDNTWMKSEFSLGMALEKVGKNIRDKGPSFQEMYRKSHEIKDSYGNVVGHFEMFA